MDIKRLRYLNARHLLKTETEGVNDFAERIGRSQSLTSAYVGERPVKNIGDKIARLIEEAFDREVGWLDTRHGDVYLEEREKEQDYISELIGKNASGKMQAVATGLLDTQSAFDHLWRERVRVERDLQSAQAHFERLASELVVLGLESQGVQLDYSLYFDGAEEYEWENPAAQVRHRRAIKADSFDLLFSDDNNHRYGVYIHRSRMNRAGWIRPVLNFFPRADQMDVDPKVAVFVQSSKEICFFILPLAPLISRGGRIVFDDPSSISASSVRLGNDDITHMKNSFEIEYISMSLEERTRLFERLRAERNEFVHRPMFY